MVKVELVPISEIRPNKYNPNKMSAHNYETLVNNIKKTGTLEQPILVTMDYEIIDGEHRWKASKDAGLTEIHAVISESLDEEAKLKTIAFNQIRGEYDVDDFTKLLEDLSESIDYESIAKESSLFISDIKSMLGDYENRIGKQNFVSDLDKEMTDESDYLGIPEVEEEIIPERNFTKPKTPQTQQKPSKTKSNPVKKGKIDQQPKPSPFDGEPVEIEYVYDKDDDDDIMDTITEQVEQESDLSHTVSISEPEIELMRYTFEATQDEIAIIVKSVKTLSRLEKFRGMREAEIITKILEFEINGSVKEIE